MSTRRLDKWRITKEEFCGYLAENPGVRPLAGELWHSLNRSRPDVAAKASTRGAQRSSGPNPKPILPHIIKQKIQPGKET